MPKASNHVITSNRGHGKIITGPEACVGPPVIILAERPRPRPTTFFNSDRVAPHLASLHV
jgi:hypothetical protein